MKLRNELMDPQGRERDSDISKADLKASEAHYRRLFETAQDGILIINADTGHIIDVNPFLVDLLGYERKHFIGKALWDFGPFKDIRASKSAYQSLMNDGYIRYEHLPLKTRDGRHIAVEFISNVYQVGPRRTIQCNIRDNSRRQQVQEADSIIKSQLEQAQKMAAVATLAGGVAHQFNNALAVVTAGLDFIETDEEFPETDEYVQLMRQATDQMSRLTRQLLAYARGGKYFLEILSLSALVEESLPPIRSALKTSIAIETDLPMDLPHIAADRSQIKMALRAILANAAEAVEQQGVIRIACREEMMTDVRVKAYSGLVPGNYVSLTICDNGKGMDEQTRRRVFEPFFTTHFPGRGLGMAAVYGMVKNHDGWISIESQAHQGTTVCVYLPVAASTTQTSILSQSPPRKTRQGAAF